MTISAGLGTIWLLAFVVLRDRQHPSKWLASNIFPVEMHRDPWKESADVRNDHHKPAKRIGAEISGIDLGRPLSGGEKTQSIDAR